MEGIPHPIPRTVEEVFCDFNGRRAGLIKALTTDVEKFYQQRDPGGPLLIYLLQVTDMQPGYGGPPGLNQH